MDQNRLFHQTRLRLAGWYAGVMGCILLLSGLGIYQVVAQSSREIVDRGLESVANAARQSLEPILQKPEHLQSLAQELSLELCRTQTDCLTKAIAAQHPISQAIDPVSYYLRLSNQQGELIAIAGPSPERLTLTAGTDHWKTLSDRSGVRYRQISLPLHSQNQLWGYLQVGRSMTDLEKHLTTLRISMVVGYPIALLLILWSSWWLAGLAMQPVYRSYEQMRQFTADAAHELRTPLTAMQSTIDSALIQQQRLEQEAAAQRTAADASQEQKARQETPFAIEANMLAILKRQNARLAQLVKDLLLLARIDQQDLPNQQSACCLNDLIADLVEELASLAIAADVTLVAQVQDAVPIYVQGNEEQLYRLVYNLIDNAIQATPPGGKVTAMLEHSDHYALIHIHDTGVGIAEADRQRIFDRFYRVQQDRSRRTGGAGLGLPIARAIAQAHSGSIQVDSEPGRGSVFTVRLPIDPV
jgi:signal transduction histidine kinase